MKHVALISTTLLLLCCATHAQTSAPNDAQLKDRTYYNLFFNIAYTAPKDWVIHDQLINDRIRERSKEEAAKTDSLPQWKHTYPLLSVTRHPRGTPGIPMNPMIFVAAEKIDHQPGNPGAKEYLFSLRETRLKRGWKVMQKEPAVFRAGGFEFLRDDYNGEVNGVAVRVSYFVTVKKGYAVIFSFNGEDEASVNEMAESMNSILPIGRGGNIGCGGNASSTRPGCKP